MSEMTLELPEDLVHRLAAEAKARGVTPDQVAAEAIAAFLSEGRVRKLGFVGLFEGRPGLSASQADEILEAGGFGRSSL